jgi:hemerythrin superfamily protein
MNAIKLLMQDHKKVRALLTELEGTTPRAARERERLVREIETELTVHAQIEEEIFYPAFKEAAKKADDRELFFEAAEEHHVVKFVLPELVAMDPASEQFSAKAKVLKELVEHHAGEEEKEMFKRAKALMDDDELEELGARLEERKQELGVDGELELVGAGMGSNGARAGRSSTNGATKRAAPKATAKPRSGATSRKRK